MMGTSGYGVIQRMTAPLNPPHLKALVVLATTDNYRSLCYPGGVLRKPFVLNLVSGLMQAALWPGPIPGKFGANRFQTMIRYWGFEAKKWKNAQNNKIASK